MSLQLEWESTYFSQQYLEGNKQRTFSELNTDGYTFRALHWHANLLLETQLFEDLQKIFGKYLISIVAVRCFAGEQDEYLEFV